MITIDLPGSQNLGFLRPGTQSGASSVVVGLRGQSHTPGRFHSSLGSQTWRGGQHVGALVRRRQTSSARGKRNSQWVDGHSKTTTDGKKLDRQAYGWCVFFSMDYSMCENSLA